MYKINPSFASKNHKEASVSICALGATPSGRQAGVLHRLRTLRKASLDSQHTMAMTMNKAIAPQLTARRSVSKGSNVTVLRAAPKASRSMRLSVEAAKEYEVCAHQRPSLATIILPRVRVRHTIVFL